MIPASFSAVTALPLSDDDILSFWQNTHPSPQPEKKIVPEPQNWTPREPKVTTGYLARYAQMVTSGNRGAILEIKNDK